MLLRSLTTIRFRARGECLLRRAAPLHTAYWAEACLGGTLHQQGTAPWALQMCNLRKTAATPW